MTRHGLLGFTLVLLLAVSHGETNRVEADPTGQDDALRIEAIEFATGTTGRGFESLPILGQATSVDITRGRLDGTPTYTTDAKGQVIEEIRRNETTNAVEERLLYTYDAAGHRVSASRYDGNGGLVARELYTYDSAGRLLESRQHHPDNWATMSRASRSMVLRDQGADAPLEASAQAVTFLFLDSEPGDIFGNGVQRTITPADATFTAMRNSDNGVSIFLNSNVAGAILWHLDFAAPNEAPLVPGAYENATRFPFQAPTGAGLSVSGQGIGCNTLAGRFVVTEAVYSPSGAVQTFAATFEQHCNEIAPALFGQIVFNSQAPANFVSRLYEQVLGRDPEPGGLDAWVQTLQLDGSAVPTVLAFFHSTEFLLRQTSDSEFLTILYHTFLNREADPAGFSAFLTGLQTGQLTRDNLLDVFIDSQEFRTQASFLPALSPLRAFVITLYVRILSRGPDPAGLQGFIAQLQQACDLLALVKSFLASPEFVARQTTNTEFVTLLYRVFLNRVPDPSGLALWVAMLTEGTATRPQLVTQFATSAEFQTIEQDLCPRPAVIQVSPPILTFSFTAGGAAPPPQSLTLINAGTGTLTFSATAATVTGGPWLSVTPTVGTAPTTLTVSVNPAGLSVGTYQGSITIQSPTASNSPQTVGVTLNVAAGPPSIAGTWNITLGLTLSNCGNPGNNQSVTLPGTLQWTQSGATIQTTFFLGFSSGAVAQVTFTGTIAANGQFSGTFVGSITGGPVFSGTFSGSLGGNAFSLQFSGQFTVGEICRINGSITGTR